MKLIGSLTSPYVRKVRIVLSEKKLDVPLELEDVWAAGSSIGQFNPLGKVPCLIMDDQGAVFDSPVIIEYLDSITPNARMIPASGRPRIEVKTWEALADGLCDAAILARLEAQRPPEQQSSALIERQLAKVHSALAAMAHGLSDKPWCVGIGMSLADIATGVALAYLDFRFPHIDWRSSYPNLHRHSDKLNARPSFAETAPPSA